LVHLIGWRSVVWCMGSNFFKITAAFFRVTSSRTLTHSPQSQAPHFHRSPKQLRIGQRFRNMSKQEFEGGTWRTYERLISFQHFQIHWLRSGWSRDRILVGARFSAPVQTGAGAHPASCTMGTRSFPGVKSGRGVTLTPHPLLMPRSRKCRAIPLLPLWAVRPVQSLSVCTRVHFTLLPNTHSPTYTHTHTHPHTHTPKHTRARRNIIL